MAFDWFRKLTSWFGGDREKKSVMRATAVTAPMVSPVSAARPPEADFFVALSVAEYDPRERGPLHPREAEQLMVLCAEVREHFHKSGHAAVAFPPLARRFFGLVGNDGCEINDLVQMVHQDPLVSAQLLKAANAAAHIGTKEANNVRQAIVRIGTREAARIAVAASLRTIFEMDAGTLRGGQATATWKRLWLHSMTVAFSAGWLSMHCGRGDVERAFLGGMLHDIGKTFALRSLSTLLLREQGVPPSATLVEAVLDAVHVDLGMQLAADWNLPAHIAAVCAGHHELPPRVERKGALEASCPDLADVHLVRVVSGLDEIRVNPAYRAGLEDEVRESAAALDLKAPGLRTLLTYIRETAARVG